MITTKPIQRALALIPLYGQRSCVVCGARVGRFLPYKGGSRGAPPLSLALQLVGSDIDHFECPRCGAHDRERHLLLYLRACGLLGELSGQAILHFAPERRLSSLISAAGPARYVPCDLFPTGPEIMKIDMLDMPFEPEMFDLVIANHVLEHVADDRRALAEIRRVLKPGGRAILQTPYSARLRNTWEDSGIDDALAREQAYGQDDHVRLYGTDIFDRIEAEGFISCVATHDVLLPDVDARTVGVNRAEPFFLFQRPR